MPNLRLVFAMLCVLSSTLSVYADDEPAPKPGTSPAVLEATYREVNQHVVDTYVGTLPSNWNTWPQRYNGKLDVTGNLRVAVDVMLSSAVDSRLRILNSKNLEAYKCRMESGYVGIGVLFHFDVKLQKGFDIQEVMNSSPAKNAGLRASATIVAIDGVRLQGADLIDSLKLLLSDKTEVRLTVLEGEDEREVTVKRNPGEKLGITYGTGKTTMTVTVEKVFAGSPAEKAGLRVGDVVTKTYNFPMAETDPDYFVSRTNGRLGEDLDLTVLRAKEEFDLKLTRGIVFNEELALGYSDNALRLTNLDWTKLPEAVDKYVDRLNAQPECVIDLRGASGENPELAARLAARFIQNADGDLICYRQKQSGQETTTRLFITLKDGKATLVSQNGTGEKVIEQPAGSVTCKLSVLVDEQTSGTAEALALALQRSGRATITGARTAGRTDLVTAKTFTFDDRELLVEVPTKRLVPGTGYATLTLTPDLKTGPNGDGGLLLMGLGLILWVVSVFAGMRLVKNRSEHSGARFAVRGALLVVLLVAGGFAFVHGFKNVHQVVVPKSEAQLAADYVNNILRTDEEARIDRDRFGNQERGKLDAKPNWGAEKPPIADPEIEAACRIVTAMANNDFESVKALIESYAHKPYARAQIGMALNHALLKAGVEGYVLCHNGMFILERGHSDDGQCMLILSPVEQPRVTVMVVDPKFPRQFSSTDNSDMFDAAEVFATYRTPLLRGVQEFRAKPGKN